MFKKVFLLAFMLFVVSSMQAIKIINNSDRLVVISPRGLKAPYHNVPPMTMYWQESLSCMGLNDSLDILILKVIGVSDYTLIKTFEFDEYPEPIQLNLLSDNSVITIDQCECTTFIITTEDDEFTNTLKIKFTC